MRQEMLRNNGELITAMTVSDITTLGEIGRGQNGSVLKALHMPTLTLTAVKTIDVYNKSTRHQLVKELKVSAVSLA